MILVNILLIPALSMFIAETKIALKPMLIVSFRWFLEDDTDELV